MINFRAIIKNNFIRVSGANGLITLAKSFLTILSNKIVATIIGTTGIAMVGQLQNIISIVTLVSNGGFNQGLTKYIAQQKEDQQSVKAFIGTAFTVSMVLSTFIGLLILIFSKTISEYVFTTNSYYTIIIVFAFTLFLYNLNSLILAVVNGFQQYKQYFKINLTTTVVGFVLTVSLVIFFKEYGALLAIVLSQSVVCLIAFIYIKRDYWVKAFSFSYFKKENLLLLLKYTAITVIAAVIWPVVAMLIRTYVIHNISPQEAGLWQATRNINDYVVNIAIGSFSVYLLPKLSATLSKDELKKELISIYKIIIPVSIVGFFLLYTFRDIAIKILYSNEFLKVGDYLLLQIIGSFFWMCKVPLMNYMLAKSHTTIYIINELIFAALYIVLAIILIPKYQVQGIQMSFLIYNFLYFFINLFIVRNYLRK